MSEPNYADIGHAYPVGEKVFIRTVTHYYTGFLEAITPGEIVITSAAWIASTGRWAECLSDGKLDEVEPFPDGPVVVNRGAVVDVALWNHDLPREQA